MKKTFLGVAAICAGALMVACSSNKNVVKTADLSGEWTIVSVDGQNINIEEMPFIGFDLAEKRIYGSSGCNRMMGDLVLDTTASTINFGHVGSTRMMCPNMDTESKVLDAVNKVKGYKATADGIALIDEKGKELMTLVKRETPAITIDDLNGKWKIEAVDGVQVANTENEAFIAFDLANHRINGCAGCNVVNGDFSQEEGKPSSLKFGQLITTMMSCPNMEIESQILQAMNKVCSFGLNQDKSVALLDADGVEVLTLVKSIAE
ncbi:META domain-containing protein [uncultured Bacteroides sp.]|uniref:META domain-containing protein n=1 Tax=uncultured Bacteroides sp. TaxID=162156 RepID=UPI002631CE19|nr:META domain-containing protein [uncultured Bacteroides sp.]